MSSGYGLNGGPSRCFPFWQELLACYVVNTTSDDDSGKKKCAPMMEDYYECLHHKKEVRFSYKTPLVSEQCTAMCIKS
ncbi:MAG: oxidation resistance protein 1 [Chaenotheca gracillima]|nr:MAG: oxidation resistance protein 1 [Chaenotheca gracillima]